MATVSRAVGVAPGSGGYGSTAVVRGSGGAGIRHPYTNPIASYMLGIMAFEVAAPRGVAALSALAGTALLLVVGIVGLAHSPAMGSDPGPKQVTARAARPVRRLSWRPGVG